ncbi:ead/Ea22-like family protein [Klebsiella aerogenes]
MTSDITELAQSHELLIANGQQIADLLRHLADNEIDSDYFAVVSECESYGKETDAELSITEFALRAAGYVDELVEALEKAQTGNTASAAGMAESYETTISMLRSRIAELEESHAQVIQSRDHYKRISEEGLKQLAEPRTFIVKLPHQAGFDDPQTAYDAIEECKAAIAAAGVTGIMWEVE